MRSSSSGDNILVLNCGSSSLKYRLIRMPDEKELVSGEVERVGTGVRPDSVIHHQALGKIHTEKGSFTDHAQAFSRVIELIRQDKDRQELRFGTCAHRYVHPGKFFQRTVRITVPVLKKLKQTVILAPIHNSASFKLIEYCSQHFPGLRQMAVFDTTFHRTIPEKFYTYALPHRLTRKFGLKKTGFHGISHQFVMEEACKFLGRDKRTQRIISCHLGTGGASVCAIEAGHSVNNSMGFTPLEGLIMNTRCGDLDVGAVFYIMAKERLSSAETENMLNKKSGVLGLFNRSSDLRDVFKEAKRDAQARMVFQMYARRVKKYIGFYSLILKKADILIFTDTLGVGLPALRSEICKDLSCLGIAIDGEKNAKQQGGQKADISAGGSSTRVLVIPTNEELMIARQAYKEMHRDTDR